MKARVLATTVLAALALVGCGGGDDTLADAPVDTAASDAPIDMAPTDAPVETTPIDAPIDGPSIVCDPLAPVGQQGCILGQKCTWIMVAAGAGQLGCVPDGNVAIDGACTVGQPGPTTGYDDCAAGGYCINAVCKDICGFDGSAGAACATGFNCAAYAGVFSNGGDPATHGLCNRSCDPLTGIQSNGQSCGANMGCYLLTTSTTTISVCAAAGTTMVREEIVGTPYANSCVPGAQPRRRTSQSMVIECGGLCPPADVTSTTNMAHEGGLVGYCHERWGRPPPELTDGESCRYWWARESFSGISPYSNTIGWCFRHNAFLYDSDNNQTLDRVFPRCVNLTTGDIEPPVANPPHNDALYFWCIATPAMLTGAVQNVRRWRATHEPRLDTLAP